MKLSFLSINQKTLHLLIHVLINHQLNAGVRRHVILRKFQIVPVINVRQAFLYHRNLILVRPLEPRVQRVKKQIPDLLVKVAPPFLKPRDRVVPV